MKPILLRLLFASILLFGLVACGSNPGPVLPPGAFTVESAKATTNTSVLVTFNRTIGDGGDYTSYYEISNPDLVVTAASVDGNRVTLTTSAQTAQTYTLEVSSVKDTEGNLIHSAGNSVTFDGVPTKPPSNSDLEETLTKFGVNLNPGKRTGPGGKELPSSFSPLGSVATSDCKDETCDGVYVNRLKELFYLESGNTIALGDSGVKDPKRFANQNWTSAVGEEDPLSNQGQTLRDAVAADLDGDDFEELVAVHLDQSDNTIKARVIRRVGDDQYTDTDPEDEISPGPGVVDIAVVAGDFSGSGTQGLAVALSYTDRSEVLFIENRSGELTVTNTKALPAVSPGATLSVELATGNIDYDSGDELAVVLNNFKPNPGKTGSPQYIIFDDAKRGFTELHRGNVAGRKVADVALGDVDADGLSEIVLGGLVNDNRDASCRADAIITIIDDAEHDFDQQTRMIDDVIQPPSPINPTCSIGGVILRPRQLSFMHVNTVDLYGDGVLEIVANQYILGDSRTGYGRIAQIPSDFTGFFGRFVQSSAISTPIFSSTTSAIAVADINNDGLEDILFQGHDRVWSFGATGANGSLRREPFLFSFPRFPLLAPINIDADGPVLRLKYSEGEDHLTFTEPLIVAAIAAPPCSRTPDQNWQDCKTTYGIGKSNATDTTMTVSTTAGYHYSGKAGFEAKFLEVGGEYRETITKTTRRSTGNHYSLEKTVFYTTGALEDSVIFTTIPYDQYTFTVLSHPDKDSIGEKIVISVPREPITILSNLDFYNATVTNQNIKIDERVFAHTTGDIDSYLSIVEKNQILNDISNDQWVENGPQNVGIGTGTITLELSEEKSSSFARAFSRDTETSIEGTGEVTLGFFKIGGGGGSIEGDGAERSFTVTTGRLTKFIGTVGSIRGSLQDSYKTGLFSYTKELDGQEFTVINYWVE